MPSCARSAPAVAALRVGWLPAGAVSAVPRSCGGLSAGRVVPRLRGVAMERSALVGASVAEGGSSCGRSWQVGAAPVVRLAGVPVSALAGLRCERSFAQIERLIALDAWLGAEGAALSEALYAVIGAVGDAGARPGLVGLRRALHRVRMPGTREWNPALATLLPAEIAQRVRQWVDRCAERKGV